MIWASSEKFGCGKARSRSGKVIVVAHYYPKGNIPGQFQQNVLLPTLLQDENDEQLLHETLSIISAVDWNILQIDLYYDNIFGSWILH